MTDRPKGLLRGRNLAFIAVFLVVAATGFATNVIQRSEETLAGSELRQIQSAVYALMTHNGITLIPNPVVNPTNDLSAFPDEMTAPTRKGLTETDKPGYVLFGHDRSADGVPEATLSYVRRAESRWTYTVARDGTVTQWEKASGS